MKLHVFPDRVHCEIWPETQDCAPILTDSIRNEGAHCISIKVSCEQVMTEAGVIGKLSFSKTNGTDDLAGGSIIPTLPYTTGEVCSPFDVVFVDKVCLKMVQACSLSAKVYAVGALRQWTISILVQAFY